MFILGITQFFSTMLTLEERSDVKARISKATPTIRTITTTC